MTHHTQHWLAAALAAMVTTAAADQVIPDDLIVQQSICIGLDCVDGESFGFDTVRLRGSGLRVHFLDTSVGTFPSNDWRIVVNDATPGGTSYFAIEDATAGQVPLRIMAGAPNYSLFVDPTGQVGLGTDAPATRLHLVAASTPALRLDQQGGVGGARAWDLGGNETGFFVRDVTGGQLPLRVAADAPQDSLYVHGSGDVGLGTDAPAATLHVQQDGAQLRVEEGSNVAASRELVNLSNLGAVVMRMAPSPTDAWRWTAEASTLSLALEGSGTPQWQLAANGNLTISGTLSQGSSRSLKTDIQPVDADALLNKVLALPLYAWRYKDAAADDRHLGPMAEDFFQMFGTGTDPTRLAPSDVAGVAVGALQALARQSAERDEQIARLRARIAAIEARLGAAR